MTTTARICQVPEGCDQPVYGRGMCSKHWQQARKGKRDYILASRIPLPRTATTTERFWHYVDKTDTCWLWTGATMPNGYGRFGLGLAHHFLTGKPPEGLESDHTCYTRNCVRPDHIEFVTRQQNISRQRSYGKRRAELCGRGHDEWSDLPSGLRQCRGCNRENVRAFRARKALSALGQC